MDAEIYRDAGDAARDARRWAEAARAYELYLTLRPDDAEIHVQHGHAVKESGDPEGALPCYRRAEALSPADPDIPVQIGHALKLVGRDHAAMDAYARGVALDPGGVVPWREWLALAVRAAPPRRAAGTVLDLSDLLAWHGHHRIPTGIQRVQWELFAGFPPGEAMACAMLAPRRADEEDLCLEPAAGWRALPTAALLRLHHLARHAGAAGAEDRWREAWTFLRDWLARAPELRFAPGSLLLNPGTAWSFPAMPGALRAARAEGLRHVPVLHDCGAVTEAANPQATAFSRWFEALPALADGVVAVSETTAAEARALAARHLPGIAFPGIAVVPMNGRTELPDGGGTPVPEEPFVLLVSSFEPRKNHALAFRAWRVLLDRRGPAGTPRLLCAGRRAAGDAAALSFLEADPDLAARVTLLHDADDATLGRLYRHCLFTLYPSSQEGWGLPVSESLAQGKVPVTAAAPALRESGGTAARTFEPGNAASLAAAVEVLLDPAARQAAEARIPPGGGLRPWGDVAAHLLAEAAAARPEPLVPDPLPLARPVALARSTDPVPSARGLRALCLQDPGTAWGAATDEGLRAGPGASLLLPVSEAGPLRLHLTLGRHEATRVVLSRDGAATVSARLDPDSHTLLALDVAAGGLLLRLAFDTRSALVAGLAILRAGRPEDRVALLEAQVLWAAEPV